MKAFFKTLLQGPKHWSEWVVALLCFISALIILNLGKPADDAPSKVRDSSAYAGQAAVNELGIRKDSLTGCQYLVSPNGTLVPRVDSTGKQVCK